ncbi:MAG: Asp-tRNA(Asn)/Glu-tRNA(Gln) amidotransferase subunit GatC, partial [Bdellovibrionales bacterium]|nr:Asp-tRNA(Asn)/Glu-tRNA(Gln) amidotransferase subunit GatC [Bdellovibrionales bacterium]
MGIDKETIAHIASLARLSLKEEEVEVYGEQLSRVLEAFEKISAVPTEGVLPMVTPVQVKQQLRADKVIPFENNDGALAAAPELV